MVFTPKFVDLVKNVTTVQGTGPVTLDQTVTGFTSFASACATGDQFYYSIQGIDKPAEREVGRGTMQADGTIVRSPIGGAATNFTKGNKYIALVAAAEWLAQVDSAIKAPPAAAPGDKLLSELSGATIAAAVRVVRSAGYAQAGVGIADYVQDAAVNAAYVTANPRAAFLAADGRGFRLDPAQRLTIEMFGGVGDYVNASNRGTDNSAALSAAAAFSSASGGKFVPTIHFGVGDYYIAQTFNPRATINFKGAHTSGTANNSPRQYGTRLISPAGVTTVALYGNGSDGVSVTQQAGIIGSDGSKMEGIGASQVSFNASSYGGSAHGFDIATQVTLIDCPVSGVGGNAYNIAGWTDGGGRFGGPNDVALIRPVVNGCSGHGIAFAGSDANAGSVEGAEVHDCNGVGIYDASYFGNCYIAAQVTGYGNNNGGGLGRGVYYSGYAYFNISPGNINHQPDTSPAYWFRAGPLAAATATYPAWSNATTYQLVNPIFAGGPCTFTGTYLEGGNQYGVIHAPSSLLIGGNAAVSGSLTTNGVSVDNSYGVRSSTGFARVRQSGGLNANWALWDAIGDGDAVSLGEYDGANGQTGRPYILRYRSDIGGSKGDTEDFAMRWMGKTHVAWYLAGRVVMTITGRQSTMTLGRSAPLTGVPILHGYGMGDFSGDGSDPALVSTGSARWHVGSTAGPPTGGYHAAGEFVWNNYNPGNGTLGWSCTTAGTPGTWTAVATAGFTGSYTGNATITGNLTVTQTIATGGVVTGSDSNGWGFRLEVAASQAFFTNKNNTTNNWGYGSTYRCGDLHQFQVAPSNTNTAMSDIFMIDINGARSLKNLGFRTGAGGTVTQATDKTTGVTLAKNCGQITMNGAALAANTAVSFTFTNSQIAATDVVNVSIASGASAGAYALTVDAVAAGSCRISLRNLSAGSLSEAVVVNFAVLKAVTA